jgi:DNA-binding transcriptional LysR family regulator
MSIRALRTLIAISHKGSFVAAAEQLGLTQAAVSLQIKNFEEALETELFDREGHKPKLNASGLLAVERAEQIVSLFDGLKTELNPTGQFSGALSLGAVHTVITGPLPAVLARLQQAHGGLRIRLFGNLSAELAKRVEVGELDGALITEPIQSIPRACQWLEYDTEPFYIVAPKDSPQHDAKALFANYPFVRFDRTAWAGTMIDAYLVARDIQPREVMEFDSCEAALSLVAEGLGITVIPLSKKRLAETEEQFSLLPFGQPQLQRRVGLYRRRQHPRSRVLDLLLDEIRLEVSS